MIFSQVDLFSPGRATVEQPVLLYGCETWSLTESLYTKLDGTYNRLIRLTLDIHWLSHTSNEKLFARSKLLNISHIIKHRRLQFAGHCYRSFESAYQPITDVIFLTFHEKYGIQGKCRQATYPQTICNDVSRNLSELSQLQKDMLNRDSWRKFIKKKDVVKN